MKLVEDPDYMLTFNFVALAKQHNFFGGFDKHMKKLAKVFLNLGHGSKHLTQNLKRVLYQEIAILPKASEEKSVVNLLNEYYHDY